MNLTRSAAGESVDYRRTAAESSTTATVYRVTYTVPLESVECEYFDTELAANLYILWLMRLIRQTRRGIVTVAVL